MVTNTLKKYVLSLFYQQCSYIFTTLHIGIVGPRKEERALTIIVHNLHHSWWRLTDHHPRVTGSSDGDSESLSRLSRAVGNCEETGTLTLSWSLTQSFKLQLNICTSIIRSSCREKWTFGWFAGKTCRYWQSCQVNEFSQKNSICGLIAFLLVNSTLVGKVCHECCMLIVGSATSCYLFQLTLSSDVAGSNSSSEVSVDSSLHHHTHIHSLTLRHTVANLLKPHPHNWWQRARDTNVIKNRIPILSWYTHHYEVSLWTDSCSL